MIEKTVYKEDIEEELRRIRKELDSIEEVAYVCHNWGCKCPEE
jgi:hypothetical protein